MPCAPRQFSHPHAGGVCRIIPLVLLLVISLGSCEVSEPPTARNPATTRRPVRHCRLRKPRRPDPHRTIPRRRSPFVPFPSGRSSGRSIRWPHHSMTLPSRSRRWY